MSTTDKIIGEKRDGVAYLTFNNPEKRNAVSIEMYQAVTDLVADFEADPAVRVVVVKGAGGKSFVAGSDISQFDKQRSNAEQSEAFTKFSATAIKSLENLSKPLIAQIQGYCVGGGVRVASTADIRIASDDSLFAVPAAKLGLGYAFASVERLIALTGPGFVNEMLFTGRRFTADEALRVGLINRVTTVEALDATVSELAQSIAQNAPLTVRAAKIAVRQATLPRDARDMAAVDASIRACFDSEDYGIGRKAFAEKRTPEFTGR